MAAMSCSVEIAATPTADTPGACIQIQHDTGSYMFGRVPEGLQRSWGSRKLHLSNTQQVFLSGSVEWSQLGGLLGFLLSVNTAVTSAKENKKDRGKASDTSGPSGKLGIHGGDNLCHSLAACRHIIFRQQLDVEAREQTDDPRAVDPSNTNPDWQDGALRVWKIPVRRARSSSPAKRPHSDSPDAEKSRNERVVSDPTLASLIIKYHMFSGQGSEPLWEPRMLSEVRRTDVALRWQNQKLSLYKGPYATDKQTIPNPMEVAYVLTDRQNTFTDPAKCFSIANKPLPPTAYSEVAMSYIVKCQDRRGKFDAPRAKALGVPPKQFSLLTQGKNATGKDGLEVTPDMVLGPSIKGRGVMVLDIPSADFMDSFMERPEWGNKEILTDIAAVYWILGPGLAREPRLQKFMADHSELRHILCSPDTSANPISHPKAAHLHTQMRCIDPDRFPPLDFDNAVDFPAPAAGSNVELGRSGMRLRLMPRLLEDEPRVVAADLADAVNSVDPEAMRMANEARELVASDEFLAKLETQERNIPNRDAEIIPLGTGSSAPSAIRNVSSTLITVPGIGNYIFDSGEGTIGQIRRCYGDEKTAEVLRGLKCVVISHLHADHHLGAISLFKAWYEQTLKDNSQATLAIVCIGWYKNMLAELSQVEDFGFHRLRFPVCPFNNDLHFWKAQGMGDETWGLESVKRVPVKHCLKSYATQLELTSGLRMAYSGDCRPSKDFARECKGAHLLIHECTFDNDMRKDAARKLHSTIGEALEVASEMRARRTLLTHFSQRYCKSESLQHEMAGGAEKSVLLAYDMMRVKLGDFQKAAQFLPAIQKLLETNAD